MRRSILVKGSPMFLLLSDEDPTNVYLVAPEPELEEGMADVCTMYATCVTADEARALYESVPEQVLLWTRMEELGFEHGG